MSDLFGVIVPLDAQIREVRREIEQRERVYPRLIEAGKLTVKRAEQQQRVMKAVLASLEILLSQPAD